MIVAAIGIVMSIVCIFLVRAGEDASQKALLKVLGRGIDLSMVLTFVLATLATYLILGYDHIGVAGSILAGLLAGWIIGKWTEYATSDEYGPTQRLAAQAETGPATVIIAGIADGMKKRMGSRDCCLFGNDVGLWCCHGICLQRCVGIHARIVWRGHRRRWHALNVGNHLGHRRVWPDCR